MILVPNERAKRVYMNCCPNNHKLFQWSISNHSLNIEELKGNIVTNIKEAGMMERC